MGLPRRRIRDGSLEELEFETGLKGWKHMAETQKQFLAEDKALDKTRKAKSSDWRGSVSGKVART